MYGINHICFLVPNYPTRQDPVYTFVRELVCSISDLGIKCSVIAPQSITNFIFKQKRKRPYFWQDRSDNNNKIDIYQPINAPFLSFKMFGTKMSNLLTEKAITSTFKKMKDKPDVIYAHFWHMGVIAGKIGNDYDLPFFVATGESEIWVQKLYKKEKIKKNLENINGVIAVSTKNMNESIRLGLVAKEKITVIPNAINPKHFYKKNKKKVREKLGFSSSDFIVAYTGAFTERKGVLRLSNALTRFEDVKSVFIGSGKLKPDCDNILFVGRLPHDKIVNYLNASDVFVLPTIAEGCSNAIIEAMACGLPIISSNLSFNDDILTEKNSIRINSNSIEEIAESIKYLKENPELRKNMASASLELAEKLNLEDRSKKVIDFIKNNI